MKRGFLPTREERRERGATDDSWEPAAAVISPEAKYKIGMNESELLVGHLAFAGIYNPLKSSAQRHMFSRLREFNPVSLHTPKKK